MAGVKGRSGGARPGAGRPPKKADSNRFDDPLEFLKAVWRGEVQASPAQVRAATASLPFIHRKLGEGGKKAVLDGKAKHAGSGKFAASAPPKLVASGGKKV